MRAVRSLARALAEPLQQERIDTHVRGMPTYLVRDCVTIKFSRGDWLLVLSDSLARAREF